MVRHDEEMFKVHPESMCRDDPAVADMRRRDYWVGDPSQTGVGHPDTNTGVGLVFPTAPMNTGLDAKLDRIIDLLTDIKRMLK